MSSCGLLEIGPNPGLGDFIIFRNLLVLSIARQYIIALHLTQAPPCSCFVHLPIAKQFIVCLQTTLK